MSPHRVAVEPAPESLEEAGRRIVRLERWTKALSGRMSRNEQLRRIALITALLCMIAAGFGAGYAVHSREQADHANDELHAQLAQNRHETEVNRLGICASARSVALAFREPQISADGTAEPPAHFRARMVAQRASLNAATDLECASLPGFAAFPTERTEALAEITEALR